jgi:hypothetical protein
MCMLSFMVTREAALCRVVHVSFVSSCSLLQLPVCFAVGESAEEKARQWQCCRDVLQNSKSTCNSSQICLQPLCCSVQASLLTLLLHHMLLLKLQHSMHQKNIAISSKHV